MSRTARQFNAETPEVSPAEYHKIPLIQAELPLGLLNDGQLSNSLALTLDMLLCR